jgi:hypothetical protein
MNPDGIINLSFSKILATDLDPNFLYFVDGLSVYDSSTFTLNTAIPKETYTITLNKLLISDSNLLTIYLPIENDSLRSIDDYELDTEFLEIEITSESIIANCSSVLECSSCSYI